MIKRSGALIGSQYSPIFANDPLTTASPLNVAATAVEECTAFWKECLDAAVLTKRQRFLNACSCRPVDRPPIWLMRQAGRVLPEYRALKEKHSFLELVRTPQLAAEITVQPIHRFDFDAAILFSDILIVPEALGQAYRFRDAGGIAMEFALDSTNAIEQLDPSVIPEKLHYLKTAAVLAKSAVGNDTALLGFAGSPWTLANFMLEGGSSKDFTRAKALFYSDSRLFGRLMEKLSQAVIKTLELQIDAGVDAIQIFDSLGGLLAGNAFAEASARWMTDIVSALDRRVPVIVFSKGVHGNWAALVKTGAQVLAVDWTIPLSEVRMRLPDELAVQGNLDPFLLTTTPETVEKETRRILEELRGRSGYIFNLGHGVPPTAKLENIARLVETVKTFGESTDGLFQ